MCLSVNREGGLCPGRDPPHPHPPYGGNVWAVRYACYWYAFLLPPANEVWGKVIFLHLSVILFTGGGGTWACWEIRATSGRYASYLNAFLFDMNSNENIIQRCHGTGRTGNFDSHFSRRKTRGICQNIKKISNTGEILKYVSYVFYDYQNIPALW